MEVSLSLVAYFGDMEYHIRIYKATHSYILIQGTLS